MGFTRCKQVLKFSDSEERNCFLNRLKTYFLSNSVAFVENEIRQSQLMAQARTKEMRDELLQRFFKTALAAVSTDIIWLLKNVTIHSKI